MSDPPVSGPPGADGRRHRTHPISPVLSGARQAGIVIVLLVAFGQDSLWAAARETGGLVGAILLVLAVAVVAGLVIVVNVLVWLRTEYFFDAAGNFGVDSGLFMRQERRLALSRLQSVDVVRPLLGRLVGMAQVRVEMAGGDESRVILSYLPEGRAQGLRAEILARSAGLDPATAEAPEHVLVVVPAKDLIVSLALRSETIALLVVSVVVVGVSVASAGIGGLGVLVLTGGLPAVSVFTQFTRFFGFTLAQSPDGLRLRHGLASVASQTVPPGRVQAVELVEPLLWRRRGWVRVNLNLAGSPSSEGADVETVLVPVAPKEVAHALVAQVLEGVDVGAIPLAAAPPRVRVRAPFQWRRLAAGATDQVFVARQGWLTSRVAVIPHARTQSVGITQGPWQRRLGVATVQVDTTPGPVTVTALHRDVDEAVAMAIAQLERSASARRGDQSVHWMRDRVGQTAGEAVPERPNPSPPASQDQVSSD